VPVGAPAGVEAGTAKGAKERAGAADPHTPVELACHLAP
jgi:hypothetical protein